MIIIEALENLMGERPKISFPGSVETEEEYKSIKWQVGLSKDKICIFGEPPENKPSWEELKVELEKVKLKYKNLEYRRKRKPEYPAIVDQLDLLYHEGVEGWKEEIKKVKDKYPKPIIEADESEEAPSE